ncbi:MAG: tetratricopeptide repeat protein [Gemmatimonadota bacterium]
MDTRAPRVAPLLVAAVALALGLVWLAPGPGTLALVAAAVLLPGRWWRWRTRRFRRGLRHLRRGEWPAARAELERFLREIEDDRLFARAQPLLNLGRSYSYRAAALSNLGVADLGAGAPSDALRHFREALDSDPRFVQAMYGCAAALRLEDRLAEAEQWALRVLEARPGYTAARILLGLVRRDLGDTAGAREALAPLEARGENAENLLAELRAQWPAPGESRS